MDALKVKYNIKPERSFEEALADAEMVIIGADFAVEYPQPLLPGMTAYTKSLKEFIVNLSLGASAKCCSSAPQEFFFLP